MTARRLLLRSATLVLVLLGARSSLAADERAPVPEKGACAPVLAELKAEFREELAKKDASDRRALAETLLARAAEEKDPVRRYVELEQAADLAERAEDVRLTLAAFEALGEQYTTYTVGDAVKAVGDIGRGSKDVSVQAEAATACIELAGDALLLGSGDATNAAKAMSSAKSLAKKAKMDGIAARAAEIEKLVASFKRAKAAFPAVEKALAEGTDPQAALAASGRYMAFGWGEWMQGMSQLAEGDDATLRELAKAERAVDEAPATREALADGWWQAAQDEKDPLARARMLARAAHHYEIVLQDGSAHAPDAARERLGTLTCFAWDRSIALTTDFSKYGPANVALATVRAFIEQQKIDKSKKDWRTTLPQFPEIEYAPGQEYYWRLETNHGEMTLRLFADTAPQHVTNFLYLTELGFFDGLTFHRVIPGFMAQGGDPTGSGSGGPGYFIDGEFEGGRKHADAGTLSMANTGKPRSDGSQFFITFRACPELDGKHTVFGELVDGMKVLKELESEGTPGGPPKSPLVIERATVFLR